jgi:hypothetical protein
MKLHYVKLGRDTLNNKKAILVAMDKLDTYAKMNREITESDQKKNNNNENMNGKSNGSKGKGKQQHKGYNNDRELKEPNPCKTHNGQQNWHNYLNNPYSRKFKGYNDSSKSDKTKTHSNKKKNDKERSMQEGQFI